MSLHHYRTLPAAYNRLFLMAHILFVAGVIKAAIKLGATVSGPWYWLCFPSNLLNYCTCLAFLGTYKLHLLSIFNSCYFALLVQFR